MGAIEEAREELVGLGDAVEAYAHDAVAAANQERFTSLPERLQRANELALELGQLLAGVEVDMVAYGQAMKPYSTTIHNPDSIAIPLADRAKTVIENYGMERMREIPDIIFTKMGMGVARDVSYECPRYAGYFVAYQEQLRKIGDRTDWLAKRLQGPWSEEKLVHEMQSGYAEIKRIIASPGL